MAKRKRIDRISGPAHDPENQGKFPHARFSSKFGKVVCYKITGEPIPDPAREALPIDILEHLEVIHAALPQNPSWCIEQLEPLVARHPNVCCLQNWLVSAYIMDDQLPSAIQLSMELCRKHPNYFFGRIGLAEALITAREPDLAEQVLYSKGKALHDCCDGRTTYHFSEIKSWFSLCCKLSCLKGDVAQAQMHYDGLAELCKDMPKIMNTTPMLDHLKKLIQVTRSSS